MRVAAAVRVSAVVIGVAGLAIGCGDVAPTAPDAPTPNLARRAKGIATVAADTVRVIERLTPLTRDVTVGAWITMSGGSLSIPEAGLRMTVPPGAVTRRTYLTVTAHAGRLVSYEFGPHGAVFQAPLQLQQDIRDLNIWKHNGDLSPTVIPIEAAYFPSRNDIDESRGRAKVHEILPADVDLTGNKVRFQVQHFSGYLLASGRSG